MLENRIDKKKKVRRQGLMKERKKRKERKEKIKLSQVRLG
jgi:hypothetical protein